MPVVLKCGTTFVSYFPESIYFSERYMGRSAIEIIFRLYVLYHLYVKRVWAVSKKRTFCRIYPDQLLARSGSWLRSAVKTWSYK